ncbi:MAG: type II CAAX endopeptidase family protein [Acidobacteriota bacterium]
MILSLFRMLAPFVLTVGVVVLVEAHLRRLAYALPPGLAVPGRRAVAVALLAMFLYAVQFAPLAVPAEEMVFDAERVGAVSLFLLPSLIGVFLIVWGLLAWAGFDGGWRGALRELRLLARRPLAEIGYGFLWGVVGWGAVLASSLALYSILGEFGVEPGGPPDLVVMLAGQSVAVRLAVSLCAGVFEEAFFRGFLQPRVGIVLSTALFVAAHAAYGSPPLLLGVTVLSLIYGFLARRRRTILASITAHALFDGIQLLVVLPAALKAADLVAFSGG